MKVAIIFIGTFKYINFFNDYYHTVKDLFIPESKKHFFVFTDAEPTNSSFSAEDISVISIKHEKWPLSSLFRYKYISSIKEDLLKYDYVIYIDADMKAVGKVSEEELLKDTKHKKLFAVQHPGFLDSVGSFEKNTKSLACVNPNDDLSTYWQGCFWGGQSKFVIDLCIELERRIEEDLKNNIIAIWYDESHLNKYLIENKNIVATMDPGYAYPEICDLPSCFRKKLMHLEKNNNILHK
jgi:hypothetical protein